MTGNWGFDTKVHKEEFRLQFEEDYDIMAESKGVKAFQEVPVNKSI
jgi:hypothetical protein